MFAVIYRSIGFFVAKFISWDASIPIPVINMMILVLVKGVENVLCVLPEAWRV